MNYFAYFSEIEQTFVRRRGKNLLLSPLDWALIEAWKERGVPLFVVLRAIEVVFDCADARDKAQPRKRPIKSLLYCRDEVEAQYAVWLETQVGNDGDTKMRERISSSDAAKSEPPAVADGLNLQNQNTELNKANKHNSHFSSAQILQHIKTLQSHFAGKNDKLNGSWQNLSPRVLIRLKEATDDFAAHQNPEQLENVLSELDHKIDGILSKLLSAETFAEVEKQTTAQLRAFKRQMPADIFRETYQTLLIKNLREAADLPRFSLFYL